MAYRGISDFRSDTVTRPTPAMRQAMHEAEVGDDVHGDDPTVIRLQEMAAEMLGMEASLFVPSGTMGNTIALQILVGRGNGVIMDRHCHIFNFESANVSRIVGGLPVAVDSDKGHIPLEKIRVLIDNPLREHIPRINTLTLEDTHNTWGGVCLELDYLDTVSGFCRSEGLNLHLDGARVFNAAVAQRVAVPRITGCFDTVMFCLSKGLAAPAGSLLAGSEAFIREARKVRKFLGGGMRQVGILAAAGIVALREMVERLSEDHRRTRRLAEALAVKEGLELQIDDVQTNFIMLGISNLTAEEFISRLRSHHILALPFSRHTVRLVVHKDIDDCDIDRLIKVVDEILV